MSARGWPDAEMLAAACVAAAGGGCRSRQGRSPHLTCPSLLHLCAADRYVRNAVRDLLAYVRDYKLDGIDLNAEVRCGVAAGRLHQCWAAAAAAAQAVGDCSSGSAHSDSASCSGSTCQGHALPAAAAQRCTAGLHLPACSRLPTCLLAHAVWVLALCRAALRA